MAYTQIPFEYWSSEAVNSVSRSAELLDLEGKGWCNEHRTDGALPKSMLRRITTADDPEADAAELVTAGLWAVVAGTGWQLDWASQQTAEKAKAESERKAQNKADYIERGKLHAAGDHSKCTKNCPHVTGSSTGTGTGSKTVRNRVPVLSSPVPLKGTKTGRTGNPLPAIASLTPEEFSPARRSGGSRTVETHNADGSINFSARK